MVSSSRYSSMFELTTLLVFWFLFGPVSSQLSTDFYATSCPQFSSIVQTAVSSSISREPRKAPILLRLHFHDCFVNGCDASILLDDTAKNKGEKSSFRNKGLSGFEDIDTIKALLESSCPGIVSCSDILTVAAREAVVAVGGPFWEVELGRRDSVTASLSAANSDIPIPSWDLNLLISSFAAKGFSVAEMVVLSGAHTIGVSRCENFRHRIYNETNINSAFAKSMKVKCPAKGGDNNVASLDVKSSLSFDNAYYNNLRELMGLLHSDQELFNGGVADSFVQNYSSDSDTFFIGFADAMVKLGNLSLLTGSEGQVRTNCRKIN